MNWTTRGAEKAGSYRRPMARDIAPVVGMIGGGQLARMTAGPAAALGIEFRVLAASADDSAAQVVANPFIGSHEDLADLLAFAQGCDVITFDHEHVPPAFLEQIQATGVHVRPGPHALLCAQDKAHMRATLSQHDIPMPAWQVVRTMADVEAFAAQTHWPVVLKTSRGGYDGRGVWVVRDAAEAANVMGQPLPEQAVWLAEEHVAFERELSAQVARSPHGQAVAYPVVQTTQIDGMCAEVIAPCPQLDDDLAVHAQHIALRIAQVLDVTGMLAVELFATSNGVYVNELAMRPHNSGHWTIEGACTSQFENHLRAVLDWPLGDPSPRAKHAVMVNIVGTDADDLTSAYRHVMARDPQVKVHLYGKLPRPGRKLGHVTLLGDNVSALIDRARHAAHFISGRINEGD
jgi:5-(carboxyamino)imidazole ribonucleotide synthase